MSMGSIPPDAASDGPEIYDGRPLSAALYLIATPIGAARDITLHALDLLRGADVLLAEDTRSLRHLMEIHGVALRGRTVLACHDHNEAGILPRVVGFLRAGQSVVYASEAGTPLVSDPGFDLARGVIAEGLQVISAPGPSAVLCALTVAGLPSDRFMFAGFPPAQSAARIRFLQELAAVPATLILYESPRRVHQSLLDCVSALGGGRQAALCRELTKRHEEIIRGTLSDISGSIEDRELKGEIALVIDRATKEAASETDVTAALERALETMRVKEAANMVAEAFDLPRRDVYQMALSLTKK